jgi:putative transport protein
VFPAKGICSVTPFLQERPLLLLFGVAALGYLFGRVSWRGFSLGVAAVLFAGLLVGYAVPGADLPDFVPQLGLVLFVYTVGIASGPGFFASLRLRGLRDNGLVLGVLVLSGGVALLLARAFGLNAAVTAGLFAGSLTNTPALAAVVQGLKSAGASGAELSAPVVAYSICYPLGVLVPLLAVGLCDRWFGVSYATERVSLSYGSKRNEPIVTATVRVGAKPSVPAGDLRRTETYTVNFTRVRHGSVTRVVHDETRFFPGDLVTVIGTGADVDAATQALGERAHEHIEYDRSEIDFQRMFVSNPEMTERTLRELQLIQKYDAVITRVRRGDVDLVPDSRFELILGDLVRVVAPKSSMPKLEKLFGDSVRRVSEVDIITFGLGITLGLLLGAIELPTPGGGSFSLGPAGGPLVVGLLLGRIGRTGRLVWAPPYGVNLTLRQFGVVLFLAGVGLRAGSSLGGTLGQAAVLETLAAGLVISTSSVLTALLLGHLWLRIPLVVMVGTLAGLHTQPAVLAYAVEKTKRELPNVGYATVFPFAMIAKILLAQVLLYWAW